MKYIGTPVVFSTGLMELHVGCSKCGESLVDPSYRFCPKCGKKLEPLPTRVSAENLDQELTKLVRKGVLTEVSE